MAEDEMTGLAGRQLLASLKRVAGCAGPNLALAVGTPPIALLRPVATVKEAQSAGDVRLLTAWRNRFVKAFLTEFEATENRTSRWLDEVVAADDCRILFMVDDMDGATIGYMAVAFIDWDKRTGEADAVVRGEPAQPGLMKQALRTMLDWARGQLGLTAIGVRVRSDNPALSFYQKCGFVEQRRTALVRHERGAEVVWSEAAAGVAGEPTLVYMQLAN